MRLVRLSSDSPSFRTVNFNAVGLTLIVGKHQSGSSSSLVDTYNGVGKSLIVALIDYCLASNRNKQFDSHIPNWTFNLEFEHRDIGHAISRTTFTDKIVFDDREMKLKDLRRKLEELQIFTEDPSEIPGLSFRSLISFFLRSGLASYTRFDHPKKKITDYTSLLSQSYLLGLDYRQVIKKHDTKKRLDEVVDLTTRYKKDKELREFYVGAKDPSAELVQLDEDIRRLRQDLSSYSVAENYSERQARADQFHRNIQTLTNKTVVLANAREDIRASLKRRDDVSPAQVISVFKEALLALPDAVVKRLDDVEQFHKRLRDNRIKRLNADLQKVEATLRDVELQLQTFKSQLDAELKFLAAHRALDEYAANSAHISELEARRSRISDYISLLTKHTAEAQRLRAQIALDTVSATTYLDDIRGLLDAIGEQFRYFAKELYGHVPSALTIKNNDGENQLRFSIDTHIQNDASDGINQGKIFCYDMTILAMRQRHEIEFVFHDNRLFADLDMNQRYSLFSVADKVAKSNDLQYIATLNEDALDSMQDVAGNSFDSLLMDAITLTLTDAPGGKEKLLGIQVDMQYDDD